MKSQQDTLETDIVEIDDSGEGSEAEEVADIDAIDAEATTDNDVNIVEDNAIDPGVTVESDKNECPVPGNDD